MHDTQERPAAPQFFPFYERMIAWSPAGMLSRLAVAAILTLIVLAIRYAAVGARMFADWSWFLGLMIGVAMLALYFATYTLHEILSRMAEHLRAGGREAAAPHLKTILSDRNFILAGLFFGLLNCAIGYSFGLPDTGGAAATLLMGFFLVGVVCGMAVFGIYGVCSAINQFAREAQNGFDFMAPDDCGGTLFIGDALVIFSSVTLIMGVMISVYILETNWTAEHTLWFRALEYVWIVFPYVMSVLVLIVPAVPVHHALLAYKIKEEALLRSRLANIRKSLNDDGTDKAQLKELRDSHEFQRNIRRELHQMRTWPFSTSAGSTYLIVLGGNLVTSLNTASGWAKTLHSLQLW